MPSAAASSSAHACRSSALIRVPARQPGVLEADLAGDPRQPAVVDHRPADGHLVEVRPGDVEQRGATLDHHELAARGRDRGAAHLAAVEPQRALGPRRDRGRVDRALPERRASVAVDHHLGGPAPGIGEVEARQPAAIHGAEVPRRRTGRLPPPACDARLRR
jgi:hypothetical protein